jgi:hypothetical protein
MLVIPQLSQEITCFLCNWKVHYRTQKVLPLDTILRQVNPVRILTLCLGHILLLSTPPRLRLQTDFFLSGFPTKNSYVVLIMIVMVVDVVVMKNKNKNKNKMIIMMMIIKIMMMTMTMMIMKHDISMSQHLAHQLVYIYLVRIYLMLLKPKPHYRVHERLASNPVLSQL